MNGWEFLDAVKGGESMNAWATIPVVITSAAGDSAATAAQKAQGYIKKPIDLDLLLNAVTRYCGSPT